MESYMDFLARINSFEKPELGIDSACFMPSNSVLQKVNEKNQFNDFYGDTVVFDLDEDVKKKISSIISRLYAEVPECFAERLSQHTLHMTLHDLSNASCESQVESEMLENEKKLKSVLARHPVLPETIHMKTNYIINMVNTSIVLTLYPADEVEYNKLISLYHLIDEVKKLPYPLTPHITLAYYSHFGFGKEAIMNLKEVVREMNNSSFDILLSSRKLNYQHFTSMNMYKTVFCLNDV